VPLPLLALLAAAAAAQVPDVVDPAALRDADLVLHTSQTAQGRAIVWATASPYAHVGLVERDGDRVYVLEAVQPVRRTEWSAWQRRGLGRRVTVLRHRDLDDPGRAQVLAAARRYLGRPYDLHFTPGEDRLYCSELVHRAYAAAGLRVGAWTRASELGLHSLPVQALLRRRWRSHPSCAGRRSLADCMPALARLEIVTPASLRADRRFAVVASSFPPALR
jgi:hypothetical protein